MPKRITPLKGSPSYRQFWRIVDGAVATAMEAHPHYFTDRGLEKARTAIVKRVTGALNGYVEQSTRGRSGSSSAAETRA
jgi:hypothetical protein